jgi:putative hydrolase of the HAD superfamily
MNPYILLCDLDGVIIKKGHYFSERFYTKQGISADLVQDFFLGDFNKCLVGTADLKDELAKRVTVWKWTGTIDELLDFWFSYERVMNEEILARIATLRSQGVRVYITTENEKYRAQYVWKTLGLCDRFDGFFPSSQVGSKKNDSRFWETVLQKLGSPPPATVEVWDDAPINIQTAAACGLATRLVETVRTEENL